MKKKHLSREIPHIGDWTDLPLTENPMKASSNRRFIDSNDRIQGEIILKKGKIFEKTEIVSWIRSGPREKIHFLPEKTKAAILTCGGLCPGLNSVIRELTMCLHYNYGVREILGIREGFRGLYDRGIDPIPLTPALVDHIHHDGGSMLGNSRGGFDLDNILEGILQRDINQVYVVGGDGTQRGALEIAEELQKRGKAVAVAGIPKTIDNDFALIDKSFGYDTAVEEAVKAINAAHVEATCSPNGLGLVKVMGRDSGFIAVQATLASQEVNVCMIPEVSFAMKGSDGLLEYLRTRLELRGHAVVLVAEGVGFSIKEIAEDGEDKSGNQKIPDVGLWLKDRIVKHFAEKNTELNLKFIDPSYMIRSVPANTSDQVYCNILAQNAVHGAMFGYTGFVTALVNNHYVYLPTKQVVTGKRRVKSESRLWQRVLDSTGQPRFS